MVHYCDNDQIGAARAKYFSVNGFGSDGGYNARWVKVMVGAVPIYFPNTTSRVRAVRLHDLHHIVTEYETYLVGEAEIEAWEIASGCGLYIAAWVLNLSAVAIGLFVAPQRVVAAFQRGRRSRNLYAEGYSESLLQETVGDLRKRLGVSDGSQLACLSGASDRASEKQR
jgi:hypothetical protein